MWVTTRHIGHGIARYLLNSIGNVPIQRHNGESRPTFHAAPQQCPLRTP